MNIEQTCKVTLTAKEVHQALTSFIREENTYRTNFKKYDECLSFELLRDGSILVLWGEVPEEEPVVTDPTPGITRTGIPIPPIDVATALQTA